MANDEEPSSRRHPAYKRHPATGWMLPKDDFPFSALEDAMSYNPSDTDIFVMTYPKCGTTWVQYMLYLLLHDLEPFRTGRKLGDFVPFIEKCGTDNLPDAAPRAIKTHMSFDIFPWSAKPRYICVARNPKDCCVSLYHHVRGFARYYHYEDGEFDDFFEDFVEGQVDCGDYFDHLLSLWNHRDRPNVLFITYEDLSEDTPSVARRIVEHVRPLLPDSWHPDITTLVSRSSFSAMRAEDPSKWSSSRPEGMPAFIRRGVVGDWKNYFTAEQSRRMDEKFEKRLSGTGAENLWSDLSF
ncbi:sulfotransferase ssu-1-like [Ornithodoros turicata]|uniref:sulfotransferase ssu-1-like n=1 Tax=Ornithodoros turicata TaxID=34597 RepID=UPI0031390BE0